LHKNNVSCHLNIKSVFTNLINIFTNTRFGKELRKYLKLICLFLIAIFILWFFGRNLNWSEVISSLKKANVAYISLATLIICLGYLLRAFRWKVLLSPIAETRLKELFAATTVGFATMFCVGRMGEIVRPMWLSLRDKRVRPSAALVTLFLERIFDLMALICFFAFNLLWFTTPVGREAEFEWIRFVGYLMLVGVLVGIISLAVFQRNSGKIVAWFESISFFQNKLGKIVLSILRQLGNALSILRDWKQLLSVIFWTISLWFAISVPTWLVLKAFDLPLDFSDSLFIMGFAAISSVVPTPGGAAGAFHTATAGVLMLLNVDQDTAAATAIIMHLVYFAPAVFFGFYYFLHGDISIESLKNLFSVEHTREEIDGEK
jgi:glycosyltransferase 2 family protein